MTRSLWPSSALFIGALLVGCEPEAGSDASYQTDLPPAVRIVELLGKPAAHQVAFVELRNDREQPHTLNGWRLVIDGSKKAMKPLELPSAEKLRGQSPKQIDAHGFALVLDTTVKVEAAMEMACESPVATTREALGPDHAAASDVLASTLALQKARHCVPVFRVDGLKSALASAKNVVLSDGASKEIDRFDGDLGTAPAGVAFERRGIDGNAFDLSPIGATPAARNFYRSDWHLLHNPDAVLPLTALDSSPWRVGNAMIELRRQADELEAQGNAAGAEELRQQALDIYGGKLPHNPLVAPFDELAKSATVSAYGAFYQLNDPDAVKALIAAQQGGADVRIATDGEFEEDEHYVAGFEALAAAGVPVTFDPRPSALSHDKFLSVDGEWLWTGSFNPIEDEPSRIHADNALVIRSTGLAQLHAAEGKIMFDGVFGVDKRKVGVGGGRYNVDGAPISVRFSPGLAPAVIKKRATELVATGDPLKACDVRGSGNKNLIQDRYRNLDPCGGPYDLIVGEVARAKSSVYFVSFSLSLEDLGKVVFERKSAGVDVRGVVDPTVAGRDIVQQLNEAGADVRATPNSDPFCPEYVSPRSSCPKNPNKVWLHHKFVLIDYGTDHPVVITGSHNLSTSAEDKNDEALLVIRDRAVAEKYYRIFRDTFDHPQTVGGKHETADLPAIAITEVLAGPDKKAPQFVEITNLGTDAASLDGLELWNRETTVALTGSLAPGQRLVLSAGTVSVGSGAKKQALPTDSARPFVSPTSGLVVRTTDGHWVTSYDPYLAEQNLPAGGEVGSTGASRGWAGISREQLDAWTGELLGVNSTPGDPTPTWEYKGFYSDWGDEHEVTDTRLILSKAPLAVWIEQEPTPGW